MADKLKFPANRGVMNDTGARGQGERANNSTLSRVWHGFLEQIYKRLSAAEEVASISTADVGSAGAAYNQTYANQQTALINELKAKVNELLTALEK